MTDLRTAAQQALEALEALQGGCTDSNDGTVEAITVWCPEIIDALKAALAEPVQEPVGYANERDLEQMRRHGGGALLWGKDQLDDLSGYTPLYTAPTQRKPLSEEEIKRIDDSTHFHESPDWSLRFARAVERAHGIT